MIESKAVATTFNGKPAMISVMRNDGHCWGRIRQGEEQFDVTTRKDWYDFNDAEALAGFQRAAQAPANVSPAAGWF